MGPRNLPDDLEPWFAGFFDDYDRLTSTRRSRRLEPRDDRLSEWLTQSIRSGDDLDIAWRLIKELVRRSPDDATLAFVAAGHLEELVRLHGETFADRLVEETRRDTRFREAMRNVWGWEDVPAGLLERITPLLER